MINHDSTSQVAKQPAWRSTLYPVSAKLPKYTGPVGDWVDAKKIYVGRKTAREELELTLAGKVGWGVCPCDTSGSHGPFDPMCPVCLRVPRWDGALFRDLENGGRRRAEGHGDGDCGRCGRRGRGREGWIREPPLPLSGWLAGRALAGIRALPVTNYFFFFDYVVRVTRATFPSIVIFIAK